MLPVRLWSYLGRGLASRFAVSFVGLFALYAVVDAIELSAGTPGPALGVASWLICRAPFALACLLPVSWLIAAMSALSAWRSDGEWDSLQASGIGPLRSLVPALLMSAAIALAAACLVGLGATGPLCRGPGHLPATEPAPWSLCGTALERNYEPGTVRIERHPGGEPQGFSLRRSAAAAPETMAVWSQGRGWSIERTHGSELSGCPVANGLEPASIGLLPLSHLSDKELERAIATFRAQGRAIHFLEAQVGLRQAIALSSVVLTFLGLALGARSRTLGQGRAALIALGLVALYWVVAALAWNAASRGEVGPWVLHAEPVVFGAVAAGVWLTRRR